MRVLESASLKRNSYTPMAFFDVAESIFDKCKMLIMYGLATVCYTAATS